MDNFYEYQQAGQEKHQRMMQQASNQRRARHQQTETQAVSPVIRQLRPILTTLINLVTK